MSSRHYEALWREGVADLVALLDAEHPEDRAAAPKCLEDWARLYIRCVQTLRKLCVAHDGVAQPQKRACLRGTLEACTGRVLELRMWLASLNSGGEMLGEVLGEQLLTLGLTPDALELPVPAYFREVRAEALAARAEVAAAAVAAADVAEVLPGELGSSGVQGGEAASCGDEEEAEQGLGSPAPAVDAAEISALQEQQPRPDMQLPGTRESLDRYSSDVASLSPEEEARRAAAAVIIQAASRGWLARRQAATQQRAEMEFLGMLPPAGGGRSAELADQLAAISAQRKQRQAARQAELDEGLVCIKAGLRQREGWVMKERIRDKLNDWFLASRDPETGEYADLPSADKGGSRSIIHPAPPQPTSEEAAAASAKAGKAGAAAGKGPGTSKPGGGKGRAAEGEEGPRCSQAFLEALRTAVQQYMDVWQEYEPSDPAAALQPPELEGMPVPKGTSLLDRYDEGMVTAEVRPVVHEEVRLEADEDMRRLILGIKDLLKADREDRKKKGGKGSKSGKKGGAKAGRGKGETKKKAGAASAGSTKGEAAGKGGKAGAAADGGEAPAKKKKGKDLTAGRSIESIFAELAAAGLVCPPAPTTVDQLLGGDRLVKLADIPQAELAQQLPIKSKTGGKKANASAAASKSAAGSGADKSKSGAGRAGSGSKGSKGGEAAGVEGEAGELKDYPEPSLAEARQAVVASCILPLGAHPALSKAQAPRTVLLYGPPGSGKSLLAGAVAHQAGASLFNLSPTATAGKYAGKAAATMVHMVFKAARALAPSVVLLEDVDQVFISDKTRAKALAPPGGEPPNRIKKQLLAEAASLEPDDGVLVLCTSRQPQACVKKDERALRTFVQRYIQLPLPDHGGRLELLGAFAQREGLEASTHLSLLAQLSEGLSAGQLLIFAQRLAARMQGGTPVEGAAGQPAQPPLAAGGTAAQDQQQQQGQQQQQQRLAPLVQAALELLPGLPPMKPEDVQAMREWTARAHSLLPLEEEPEEGKKGGKAKKK